MDKLLIVDDEILTREGLTETVDWQSHNITVVGVAENGKEGLEMARSLKPDLIIADVRMPVMDGLEMAGILFGEGADLSVIVLSGYADFENARRALNFGVAGFLLKPIDNNELLTKAVEVLNKLHKKRQDTEQLGQISDSLTIITKHKVEKYFDGEYPAEKLQKYGIVLPKNGTLVYITTEGDYEPFLQECRNLDCRLVQQLENCAVVVMDCDKHQTVVRLTRVLEKILHQANIRYNVSATEFDSANAKQCFDTAVKICQNSRFFFINSVATEDYGHIKKLVRDALAIIEKKFNTKISVKSVAYELYTSESTLMHEFKSQTGKTFNECLTEYRMAKAKELLLEGKMRIGEIGYAVGYTDVKYFGKVFKDYFGCTPTEFLEKYGK